MDVGMSSNDDDGLELSPLDNMEEEQDSLLRETRRDRASLLVRRRKPTTRNTDNDQLRSRPSLIGTLRHAIGQSFSTRHFVSLSILAVTVLLMTKLWSADLLQMNYQHTDDKPPHHGSFGGDQNPGYGFNNNTEIYYLPKSNVGHAVHSIDSKNIENGIGHYWHDPWQSPFASQLYEQPDASEQETYEQTMATIAADYGVWDPPAFEGLTSPNYHDYLYKDVTTFPAYSWQTDTDYLQQFLDQAKQLLKRVKLGIYQEYGYQSGKNDDYQRDWEQKWGVRIGNFQVKDHIAVNPKTEKKVPGIAFLNHNAWDGLIRKLLHAIMTQDEFYVVAVGPTQEGHNFVQSSVMQFHYLLEPVLKKLGVRLITRNMGMPTTTAASSLAGASIYGEADIFWYNADDNMEEESPLVFDLLHKQALLSGERMPIILTPNPVVLMRDTDQLAWVGNIQPGTELCGETRGHSYPIEPICWNVHCPQDGNCPSINDSVCWVNRTDVHPITPQDEHVYRAPNTHYLNANQQLLEGRKLAMLVIRGLDAAISQWQEQTEVPLDSQYWHVQDVYQDLRNAVRSLERKPGHSVEVPKCEILLKPIDPMICHMSMRGITEWTPRVNPFESRLLEYVVNDLVSTTDGVQPLYEGIDLLPMEWRRPKNLVDAHLIALATNSSHSGTADGNNRTLDTNGNNDHYRHRQLTGIDPNGWTLYKAPVGFCDGSSQSTCNRVDGNTCLMANHNFYRAGILGHANSGKLFLKIPIQEGVILARFDWASASELDQLPDDFRFIYSVAGNAHSKSKKEFMKWAVELEKDLVVVPLYVNRTMSHDASASEDANVEIQITSKSGVDCRVLLTHIYYA